MMDGLNDMTMLQGKSGKERIDHYLGNMRRVCDLIGARPIKLIFTLQPFLPQKNVKSKIEGRVLELSCSNVDAVQRQWDLMRQGISALAREKGALVVDTSGVMDSESKTVFTDVWHFADSGHAILGDFLAEELRPILLQEPLATKGCVGGKGS
jgi:hypothetical protein